MKKQALFLLASVVIAVSQGAYGKSRAASTEDVKAQLSRLAANGASRAGFVTRPAQGRFAIVLTRDMIPTSIVESAAGKIARQFNHPVECLIDDVDGRIDSVRMKMKDGNLSVGIFLQESDALPMSLISMEERWALVNISRIFNKNTSLAHKEQRLRKELSRVCKALFSGASLEPNTTAVQNGEDLQSMTAEPIDANTLMAIIRGMPSYGLVAPRTVPYHRACKEGWAPAPTNDVQRAIWNKVHEIPDRPLTIEYDPKRDR